MTRQRDHDRRRLEQGWRCPRVWLDPATLAALNDLRQASGASEQEAIRSAVRGEAASYGFRR